jgi:uncharacterized protein (DUF1697 family)
LLLCEVVRMALVAFLRGVNVGGHRRFRPSLLAKELAAYDVVNVGATGLLVVRNPRSPSAFRAELLRRLPFETDLALCEGRELMELRAAHPFDGQMAQSDVVPFVSVLIEAPHRLPGLPITIPADGEWFVRLSGQCKRFIFGLYRRHMKTIRYLGRIDAALGVRVTTRSWKTILATIKILERS